MRRRDPLLGFLARLNCCFFWFHPLAWWLERELAATAEHACDDAAVIAIGDSKGYAEILVDMARAVHRRGGRLSWHGIGVDGNGLLAERIDRICRHETTHKLSNARKILVALSCAAVIVLGVTCHQHSRPTVQEEQQALARVQASELRRREEIVRENAMFRRIEPFYAEMRNSAPEPPTITIFVSNCCFSIRAPFRDSRKNQALQLSPLDASTSSG
ncbi:MAG: M56 family metallopeptidase, partial [Chloroflexi bacterium]